MTMENEIRRYADGVQTLEVLVLDEKGRPVSDLPVSFEVVNYAAFRPIANCHTDMEGKVRLSCGAGSLHLYCGRQDKAAEEYSGYKEGQPYNADTAKKHRRILLAGV